MGSIPCFSAARVFKHPIHIALFHESAHTEAMMMHAMDIFTTTIGYMNPTQTPVYECDWHLFATGKTRQDMILIMIGGLHIEMNFVKLIGDWLTGSGWTSALAPAEITTSGWPMPF